MLASQLLPLSAASSPTQPAPPSSPPPSSRYTSPDWLDARIQVYQPASTPPSYDARIVLGVYLAHAILLPLFISFGVLVAGHRFRKRRLLPFQRIAGRVVPLAVESWVVFSLAFLILRWLHSILLLLDVLPTFALREFSNDIGYSVFHIAVLLYVYAILHSTPILTTLPEGRHPLLSRLGAFQARHQTGFRLLFMANLLLVFVPNALAVLGGLAADSGDAATAVQFVKIHYLLWTAEVVVVMVYFVVCGFLLSLHIGERVQAARDEGMEGPGLDAITVSMQSPLSSRTLESSEGPLNSKPSANQSPSQPARTDRRLAAATRRGGHDGAHDSPTPMRAASTTPQPVTPPPVAAAVSSTWNSAVVGGGRKSRWGFLRLGSVRSTDGRHGGGGAGSVSVTGWSSSPSPDVPLGPMLPAPVNAGRTVEVFDVVLIAQGLAFLGPVVLTLMAARY
ncbi:hypothetical protein DFJ73DRAFT_768845 [Zopfochytrium polystomum]|nr:hypothetical protein DFJ73DRAFT_768845 [Zopfochytrium polystomum]